MNEETKSKVRQFLSGSMPVMEEFAQRNAAAYREMLSHLKEHRLVPFWGAGFTAGLYPSIADLVERIAAEWQIDVSSVRYFDLENKIEHLIGEIGDDLFLSYFSRLYSKPRGTLSPSRMRVREIFRTYHLTTNYDRTIEELPAPSMPPLNPITPQELEDHPYLTSLVQQNKRCLIKLHGDIEDRQNIILTKRSYDTYYPAEGRQSAIQRVLDSVLSSSHVFFIGCNIEEERILQMMQRYTRSGTRFYALLPLPESTANWEDAYRPLLREPQARHDYLARESFLAKHDITPIWYPYDQHEFVDGFLDLLYDEMNGRQQVHYKKIKALPAEAFIGRDAQIRSLYQTLEHGRIACVSGGPGIGKSELSRQVMARRQAEDASRMYLEVDCQEIVSLDALYMSCIITCNPTADKEAVLSSEDPLRAQAMRLCGEVGNVGLLLDNVERLYEELCMEGGESDLLAFICDLHDQGAEMIIASRDKKLQSNDAPPSLPRFHEQCDHINLQPLRDEEARALFRSLLHASPLRCEGKEFEELLFLAAGNPVTINIVSALAMHHKDWRFVSNELQEYHNQESPLTLSCRSAWAVLGHDERAKILWGVLAWSSQPMELSWICSDAVDAHRWRSALTHLFNLDLATKQGETVSMITPLRQEFAKMEQAGEGEMFDRRRVAWWLDRIKTLCARAFNPEIVAHLPLLLQVMQMLLTKADAESIKSYSESLVRYSRFDLDACHEYWEALLAHANMIGEDGLRACAYRGMAMISLRRRDDEQAGDLLQRAHQLYMTIGDHLGLAHSLKGMGDVARLCDRIEEALSLYERAEQLYEQVGERLGLAQTLRRLGDITRQRTQYDEALLLYERAERLYSQVEDHRGLTRVLSSMGDIARQRAQYDEALALYERVERLYGELENPPGLAHILTSMGDVARLRAQYDDALAFFERAERLYDQLEDHRGLVYALSSMGDVARLRGEYDEAMGLYQRAEQLYLQLEDARGLAYILKCMGELGVMRARYDEAIELYARAQQLYAQEGDDRGLAYILKCMGELEARREHYDEALVFYQSAEQLYRQLQDDRGLAYILKCMGEVAFRRVQYDEALVLYQRAQQLYVKLKNSRGQVQILKIMGDVAYMRDDYHEAMELYEKAEKLYLQIGDNLGLAYVILAQGQICYMRDQEADALQYYERAEAIFIALGDRSGEAYACEYQADALRSLGQHAQAERIAARAEQRRSEIG